MDHTPINAPKTFLDCEMNEPEFARVAAGEIGMFSDRCPGKSTPNEDSAAIIPFGDHATVLVVADGMGGHAAGDVASQTAINEMVKSVSDAETSGALLRTGIIDGFERANEKVKSLAAGAGTTLAVVELSDGQARTYHAGDSIILIVGSHGRIKLETTSHSPVGYGVEAGFIDKKEAANHDERHLVLNAIGSESMRIDIGSPIALSKRDTVVLASDGLSDNLSTDETVDRIRKGSLETSMQRLVDDCRKRMSSEVQHAKPDDLTIVVFRPAR